MAVITMWNGSGLRSSIHTYMAARLPRALQKVADTITMSISTQGPPRSKPFNPPHVDKRVLVTSYEIKELDLANLTGSVGSDVEYAILLELGTEDVKPRPHIVVGLIDSAPEVAWALSH